MILTAHQPVYLPWLGLFHKIAMADTFVSFNQVQYLPKDWNNRNKIKTPNGPIWLTTPVLKSGYRDKRLVDIEINNSIAWQRKQWRSIEQNYKKTPYFQDYAEYFEDVYLNTEWQTLCELNDSMLKWFLKTLGIEVEFLDAGDFNFQGAKNDLVLDMCVSLKADLYIFGAMGRDYADVASFQSKGVEVYFQDYDHPTYPQLHGDFVSHLSILDLLFNCGPAAREVIMAGNKTRDELAADFGLPKKAVE